MRPARRADPARVGARMCLIGARLDWRDPDPRLSRPGTRWKAACRRGLRVADVRLRGHPASLPVGAIKWAVMATRPERATISKSLIPGALRGSDRATGQPDRRRIRAQNDAGRTVDIVSNGQLPFPISHDEGHIGRFRLRPSLRPLDSVPKFLHCSPFGNDRCPTRRAGGLLRAVMGASADNEKV